MTSEDGFLHALAKSFGREVLASPIFQVAWLASLALGASLLRLVIPSTEALLCNPFRPDADRTWQPLFFAAERLLCVSFAVLVWACLISPCLAFLAFNIINDPRSVAFQKQLELAASLLLVVLGGAVVTRRELLREIENARWRRRSSIRDSDRLLALLSARSGPAARLANGRGGVLERVHSCLTRFEGSSRGAFFLEGLIASRGTVTGDGQCWLAIVARGSAPNMECFVVGIDISPLALSSSRTNGDTVGPPAYRFCLGPGAVACDASSGSDVVAVARAGGFVDVFRHDPAQLPSHCLVPVAAGLGGIAPEACCPQELVVSASHDGTRVGLLVPSTRELVVFDVCSRATVARLSAADLVAGRGEVLDQGPNGYPIFEPGALLSLSWDATFALVSNGGRDGVVLDLSATRSEDSVVARPSATCRSLREGMVRWTWTGPARACLVAEFEEGGSSWFAWDGAALRELPHAALPTTLDELGFSERERLGERAWTVAPTSWGAPDEHDRTAVGIMQHGVFVWRSATTGEQVKSPVGELVLIPWLPSSQDLRGEWGLHCFRVVWRRSPDARVGRGWENASRDLAHRQGWGVRGGDGVMLAKLKKGNCRRGLSGSRMKGSREA